MKYCISYNREFKFLDDIQELEIEYDRKDTTLPAFLEKYADKTIIISISTPTAVAEFIEHNDMKLLEALFNKYHNIKLRFNLQEKELLNIAKASSIPYFFYNFVDDWDTFVGILALRPSDIYITNEMGFSLKQIAEIAHAQHTAIRVFPNVAQSSWKETPALKKFFIRPEDIDIYAQYVDVCEFFGKRDKLNIYYDVYANDKEWFGDLKELIVDLDISLDSRRVVPAFARYRSKCRKRCQQGRPCAICDRIADLADTLENQDLLLRIDHISR